jgi:hypothetical protein
LVLRSHFAVGRFLGCVVFLRPAAPTTIQRPMRPLCGFRVPPESYHRDLVRQPQPADTSRGLSLPSAHQGSEVYLTRARPPATFRPQGLATLSTAYSLRAPAGLFSYRRRSWDSALRSFLLPKGTRRVSAMSEPAYRFSRRYSRPPKRMGRPNEPRFPGFHPFESPWQSNGG